MNRCESRTGKKKKPQWLLFLLSLQTLPFQWAAIPMALQRLILCMLACCFRAGVPACSQQPARPGLILHGRKAWEVLAPNSCCSHY